MLYFFVRPIARIGLSVFYRHIYFSHPERIPKDKPVILACNHPTAFIEPCLLACFLDRSLYFLVRGNLFKKPIYDLLLRSLHMLPIFRLKDGGYGKLKSNYQTFQAVFQALEQNRTVMILAEGSTKQCKRLRPLQKGAARLALGALEASEHIEEVYVVPVGVNFTYAERPRSEVMVAFGEPIPATEYQATYRENANQGIRNLTEDLFPAMEQCLVNIPNQSDEELVEHLLRLQRSNHPKNEWAIFEKQTEALRAEQEMANKVAAMPPAEKRQLADQAATYFERLGQFGLSDRSLKENRLPDLVDRLKILLGFPFFALGRLLNFPLIWPSLYISRNRVKTHEFVMPVRWAVALGTYLLATIGVALAAALNGWWWLIGTYGLLLALGWFSLYYAEFRQRYRKRKRLSIVPAPQLAKLQGMRQELMDSLFGRPVAAKS